MKRSISSRPLRAAMLAVGIALGAPAAASAADITVNDNTSGVGPPGATCSTPAHSTIQAGVNAATAGDNVLVCAGTYNESVTVNTQISLRGAQFGKDARPGITPIATQSVITGEPSGAADGGVIVTADGVTIDGFTVQDANDPSIGSGITLSDGTGGSTVSNNVMQDNTIGLTLSSDSGTTTVRHNLFKDNNQAGGSAGNGIYGDFGADDVQVDENLFVGNDNAAMTLTSTGVEINEDVEFTDNELSENRGVALFYADGALIENNSIHETDSGDGNGRFSAIYLGGATTDTTISNNRVSNASTGVRIDNSFFPAEDNSDVDVLGNRLRNNDRGMNITDTSLGDELEAHFNRIVDNSVTGIENPDTSGVDAENNWWGCNEGPADPSCDGTVGTVDADPWLVFTIASSKAKVKAKRTATITAGVTMNSDGDTPSGNVFPETSITFGTNKGSVNPQQSLTSAGAATTTYKAPRKGRATISANLDTETATVQVKTKKKK